MNLIKSWKKTTKEETILPRKDRNKNRIFLSANLIICISLAKYSNPILHYQFQESFKNFKFVCFLFFNILHKNEVKMPLVAEARRPHPQAHPGQGICSRSQPQDVLYWSSQ